MRAKRARPTPERPQNPSDLKAREAAHKSTKTPVASNSVNLYNDDPDLLAYLNVLKSVSKKKTWANDDSYLEGLEASKKSISKTSSTPLNNKFFQNSDSEDEESRPLNVVDTIASSGQDESQPQACQAKVNFFSSTLATLSDSKPESYDTPSERPLTYKQRVNLERRQRLHNPSNWNTFFVNNDAVLECISRQMGMKKIDLLNPKQSEDMAARVALAETHVIAETKQYLLQQGVRLDDPKFSTVNPSTVKRSKTTILIKNIPFDTEDDELASIFTPFGTLLRLILPPTKAIAIVEFAEAKDAAKAFSSMAYRRFKYVPLYLEWVPEGFIDESLAKSGPCIPTSSFLSNFVINEDAQKVIVAKEELDSAVTSTDSNTLFIKNISFATKEKSLHALLSSQSGFVQCSISMRKDDKKKPGQLLSCGYGFAEFDSHDSAQTAMFNLKGSVLDGHILIFKASMQHSDKATKALNVSDGDTKLLIRNIPFEATVKDVRALFQPFGQIKRLKLPKKFDGSHRGFGFIEFNNHNDALAAFESVRHSHLYGRHLVLEWAQNDHAVDSEQKLRQLRDKSRKEMDRLTSNVGPRNQKKVKLLEEQDEFGSFPQSDAADDSE